MSTNNKKDLQYYLQLDYDITIVKIEDEDGYYYKAYSKELNPDAFYGVGDTKNEAIESFEEVREDLIPYYYENNLPIPEPKRESADLPSGKFVVRTSPYLHKKLIQQANRNNQSLNSYVNSIFLQSCTCEEISEHIEKRFSSLILRGTKAFYNSYQLRENLDITVDKSYGKGRDEINKTAA